MAARRETVRERLQRRLADLGWTIAPGHTLVSAQGYYRVTAHLDDTTTCWSTYALREGDPYPSQLVSYDTMTSCARGCTVAGKDGLYWVTATE